MNINNFVIDKDYLLEVHNNTIYNKTIVDYYKKYFSNIEKHRKGTIKNTIESIENCNKFFKIDKYTFNLVKDFKKTNLCKSKFCNNCKKVKQASRMSRYIPEIENYKDIIYHTTFTLPSINGCDLKNTLKKMVKCFRSIILYINGSRTSEVFDFRKLGYKGCIRSLEITFKEDLYHPHFHCCFCFENLDLEKKYKNSYSYDKYGKKDIRLFSEFEILIQKMWYMFLNGITFNKENFDNLELGYSCMCDKFKEGDYAELFKYMTKSTDEKDNILTYENFVTLLESTYNFKQIQGYGCFYRINDEDLEEEIEKYYCDIKDFLSSYEKPIETLERPFDLLQDKNFTLISRKKIYQYLKSDELKEERQKKFEELKNIYGDVLE